MSRDLNLVSLLGRLTRDPEIKYTASGTAVAKFSIANNYSYMQNNELKEEVNYFDVNVWGNQAISCEKYLKKGSQVAVAGSLKQNRWNDQTSGQARSKVEITANSVQFLSMSNDMSQKQDNQAPVFNEPVKYDNNPEQPVNISSDSDDDIPF
jgi:single-strand DNA-binding protein